MNNTAEQMERLNSQVRLDGRGEDPVIQAVLSDDFANAKNSEAIEIALMLQQLIRGQNSMLSQQEQLNEELNKLRGRMDGYDKDAKKWNDNREDFIKEQLEKAEDLRISDPKERERLLAREAQHVQATIQKKMAENAVEKMRFDGLLKSMPTEIILPMGRIVTVNDNGVVQQRVESEVIKIKHRTWVLQPGVPTEVPKLVADEWKARNKMQMENAERKALLNANAPKDNMVVAQKWGEINKKYGSAADQFRADER